MQLLYLKSNLFLFTILTNFWQAADLRGCEGGHVQRAAAAGAPPRGGERGAAGDGEAAPRARRPEAEDQHGKRRGGRQVRQRMVQW